MRLCVLASGSTGNVVLVDGGGVRVVIDAGLSLRELRNRAGRATPAPSLDAVLLTHEHQDHAGHAASYRRAGLDVYATRATTRALGLDAPADGEPAGRRTPGAVHVVH